MMMSEMPKELANFFQDGVLLRNLVATLVLILVVAGSAIGVRCLRWAVGARVLRRGVPLTRRGVDGASAWGVVRGA